MNKREWRERALKAEKARTDDYLHATVHEAEHNGLAEMARHLLAENSTLWDDWTKEHALALKLKRKVRRWKKLSRSWQAKYNMRFDPAPGTKCLRCGHTYETHSDSFCMGEGCECDFFCRKEGDWDHEALKVKRKVKKLRGRK